MIYIDRPCCDTPLAIEMPVPPTLQCPDCATTWEVADATITEVALAA